MNRKPLLPARIETMDEPMAQVLRSKTGAERLRIANGMYRSARQMLLSHLRSEHADWDEVRLSAEVARRLAHGAF